MFVPEHDIGFEKEDQADSTSQRLEFAEVVSASWNRFVSDTIGAE